MINFNLESVMTCETNQKKDEKESNLGLFLMHLYESKI